MTDFITYLSANHCDGTDQVAAAAPGSGVCFKAPPIFRLANGNVMPLAQVQNMANADAVNRQLNSNAPVPGNATKNYCGRNVCIRFWTLYYMAYGHNGPHAGFVNPFYYAGIGTGPECMDTIQRVLNAQNRANSNNNNNNAAPPPPGPPAPQQPPRRNPRRG